MILQHNRRRSGLAAMDLVICTGVTVPIAAAAYAIIRLALNAYYLILGSSVGSPLF